MTILLLVGVTAAVVFVAVLLIEGARRPDYDPMYHTGSELELGERGWVQRANFLLMGGGVLAYSVGVARTLNTNVSAVLLAVFGLGLIVAGVFAPDPLRGYPPGAQSEAPAKLTWQHWVHAVVGGPVAFFALFAACLTVAGHLEGAWRLYTVLTAVAGLALTISTALAFQKDAAKTGLINAASSWCTGFGSCCWASISSWIRPSPDPTGLRLVGSHVGSQRPGRRSTTADAAERA